MENPAQIDVHYVKPEFRLTWYEKLLVYYFPIRCVRKKAKNLYLGTGEMFAEYFAVPIWKFKSFEKKRNTVETVVLGSSHAYYGYFAEDNEFNLADVSMDLELSYQVYAYWANKSLPKLKNVVVFYDVFSPGNRLELSSESFRLVPYEYLYGIRRDTPRQGTFLQYTLNECRDIFTRWYCIYDAKLAYDNDYHGNFSKDYGFLPYRTDDSKVSSRVAQHVKLSTGDQARYLRELVKLSQSANARVYIVIPPLRDDYRKALQSCSNGAFGALQASIEGLRNVSVVDLQSDSRFNRDDFNDMDHLNERGAQKLSAILRTCMNESLVESTELERRESGHGV